MSRVEAAWPAPCHGGYSRHGGLGSLCLLVLGSIRVCKKRGLQSEGIRGAGHGQPCRDESMTGCSCTNGRGQPT